MRVPTTSFYQVRPNSGWEWARIWITSDGCISIMSDYGNYGYWFGDPGGEFRRFLTKCDDDYLLRKFSGSERDFAEKETVRAVRDEVLRMRRTEQLTMSEAKHEWQLILDTDWLSEWSRQEWFEQTKIGDAAELMRRRYPNDLWHFMKKLWPVFVEKLKTELAAEAADAHPGFGD